MAEQETVYGSLRGMSLVKEKGISNLVALTGTSLTTRTVLPVEIVTKRNSAVGTRAMGFAPRTRLFVTTVSMMKPALDVASSAM